MSFLYPLGFLGLLAIPLLIIIYIIKSKYTEQVTSSTYLWTLSEKFLKRKNPINKLTGIISLILQIFAVIFISFAIAHPVFVLPHAAGDYCFILDGSGSMNITRSGKTRFDEGKERISSLIKSSADGSSYSFILAGENTEVIFESLESKSQALELLDGVSTAYVSTGVGEAMNVAQKYFTENPGIKTYLITDKEYSESENVTIVNLSSHEENYAVTGVEYAYSGGGIIVTGNAVSYENDATVTVDLFVDGGAVADSVTLELQKLQVAAFSLSYGNSEFKSLRVAIAQSDALALDNEVIIYNERSDSSFKTLIVSDAPFFINSVFYSLGNVNTDVMSLEDYGNSGAAGYGLYVFDGYSPDALPADGAVWFINPVKSTESSGFRVDGDPVNKVGKLAYSTSSATRVRNLLKGVVRDDVYVAKYVKCGLYRNFITLATIDGNPAIFAGTNAGGNREAVVAFDLHDSDFALSLDFIVVMNNLLNFTFPEVFEDTSYYCGELAQINILSECSSIRVDTPLGNVEYLNTDTGSEFLEYELKEVGVYTFTLIMGNGSRSVNLFAEMPEAERFTTVTAETEFYLSGDAVNDMRDGRYEDLLYLFIVLAVIVIADWVVYCYEQYQL